MQNVIAVDRVQLAKRRLERRYAGDVLPTMSTMLAVFYVLSLAACLCAYNRMMAIITQGSLMKLRVTRCSTACRTLPIKYFDTHNHGDIMSHYTNDIDTLRQMISQSLPQLFDLGHHRQLRCLFIMLYYCVWLTLVVLAGVVRDAGRHQKDRRPVGAHTSFASSRPLGTDGGLYRGDDERTEGRQGVLP